jgi:hypothetical protein
MDNEQPEVTIDYDYDPLYRLRAADYSDGTYYHYRYDAVGNREVMTTTGETVTNYLYDDADRLVDVNGMPYSWDNNGNLLSDGVYTYTFSTDNRLSSVVGPSSSVDYAYNGLGDRLQQTVNSVTTNYGVDMAGGLT